MKQSVSPTKRPTTAKAAVPKQKKSKAKASVIDFVKKNIQDNDEAARVIYTEPVSINIAGGKRIVKTIRPETALPVRISEQFDFAPSTLPENHKFRNLELEAKTAEL